MLPVVNVKVDALTPDAAVYGGAAAPVHTTLRGRCDAKQVAINGQNVYGPRKFLDSGRLATSAYTLLLRRSD